MLKIKKLDSKVNSLLDSFNSNKVAMENLNSNILKQVAESNPNILINFLEEYSSNIDINQLTLEDAEYLRIAGDAFTECSKFITDNDLRNNLIKKSNNLIIKSEDIHKNLIGKIVQQKKIITMSALGNALSFDNSRSSLLDLSEIVVREDIFRNKKFSKLIDSDINTFEDLVRKIWINKSNKNEYFFENLEYHLKEFDLKLEMTEAEISEYKRRYQNLQLDKEQFDELVSSVTDVYAPGSGTLGGEYYIGNKDGEKPAQGEFDEYDNTFSIEYYFRGRYLSKSLCNSISKQVGIEGNYRYCIGIQLKFIIEDISFNKDLEVWEIPDYPSDNCSYGYQFHGTNKVDLFRYQYNISKDIKTGNTLTTFEYNLADDEWKVPDNITFYKQLDEPEIALEIKDIFARASNITDLFMSIRDEVLLACKIPMKKKEYKSDEEIPFWGIYNLSLLIELDRLYINKPFYIAIYNFYTNLIKISWTKIKPLYS